MARLQEQYKTEIRSSLQESLGLKNIMAVPRLEKVIVSAGTGSPTQDKNRLPAAIAGMTTVTGQKPQVRRAKKSVSNFKTRRDYDVGCMVTLRGRRMYEFLDRLINAAIPRTRDFRGLNPRSFDGRGNYSMGLADESIFAEIDLAKQTYTQGLNITLVTSSRTDSGARALLAALGMPFRKTEEQAV